MERGNQNTLRAGLPLPSKCRCFRAPWHALGVAGLAASTSVALTSKALADTPVDAPAKGTLLVRKRSIRLFVPDVNETVPRVLAEIRAAGGQLQSQLGAHLSARVAEARVFGLRDKLRALGDVESESASAEDVTVAAADIDSEVRGAERARAELVNLLGRARTVNESLMVERRIGEIDREIADANANRRALEQRALAVELEIDLVERSREQLAHFELPFVWLRQMSLAELMRPTPPEPERAPVRLTSNIDLSFDLNGRLIRDRPTTGDDSRAFSLIYRMRGVNTNPIGFAAGIDSELGGVSGFVYAARLMAGLGTALGGYVTLGLIGGAGVDGWTGGRVPSGIELPVELFTLIDIDEAARLSLYVRPSFIVARQARQDGAEHALFFDELSAGAALLVPLLLGNEHLDHGGLRLGFEYRELLGTEAYLVSVGIGFGFRKD